jgi:fumarate reductase subunit C
MIMTWFTILSLATMYSMYKKNTASKFDVFIAFVLSPLIAMLSLFAYGTVT